MSRGAGLGQLSCLPRGWQRPWAGMEVASESGQALEGLNSGTPGSASVSELNSYCVEGPFLIGTNPARQLQQLCSTRRCRGRAGLPITRLPLPGQQRALSVPPAMYGHPARRRGTGGLPGTAGTNRQSPGAAQGAAGTQRQQPACHHPPSEELHQPSPLLVARGVPRTQPADDRVCSALCQLAGQGAAPPCPLPVPWELEKGCWQQAVGTGAFPWQSSGAGSVPAAKVPVPNAAGDMSPLPELAGSVTARPQRPYSRAERSELRPGVLSEGTGPGSAGRGHRGYLWSLLAAAGSPEGKCVFELSSHQGHWPHCGGVIAMLIGTNHQQGPGRGLMAGCCAVPSRAVLRGALGRSKPMKF